jgi:hypothetical protein
MYKAHRVRIAELRNITAAALSLFVVLAGLVCQKLWLNEDDADQLRLQAAERLAKLPLRIGPWQATELDASRRELERTGATAILGRIYRQSSDGASVSALLLVGPFGPIAVHPPDVCLPAAGWREQRQERRQRVLDIPGVGRVILETTVFAHRNETTGVEEKLVVWWGWNDGTGWQAPANPRLHYAGRPVLYKLYLMTAAGADTKNALTLLEEFARSLFTITEDYLLHP